MGVCAIFGGTFNPPHIGHKQIVEALNALELVDEILVIPTKIPPHKQVDDIASEEDRLKMCEMLVSGISKAKVSDIEFLREGRSYTIDTLTALKEKYPDKTFALTVGADMLTSFDGWKEYEKILSLSELITFFRGDSDKGEYALAVERFSKDGAVIHCIDKEIFSVSSTQIRNMLKNVKSVSNIVDHAVYCYIVKNKLYGLGDLVNNLKGIIRDKLDDYRYNHSLCVADEALRLAAKYGADPLKAYIAGLLHDITKNYSADEHLQFAEKFDIMFSDVEKVSPNLWHAITGACYVEKVLGIEDTEIVGAIRYHTTAKADMGLLEKIIYLADFTSADRTYPDVDVMRRLVDVSLFDAIRYSLDYLVNDLARRGLTVHPDTALAYEQIKSQKS